MYNNGILVCKKCKKNVSIILFTSIAHKIYTYKCIKLYLAGQIYLNMVVY